MSKFKVGDKVRCVKYGLTHISKGNVYEIISVNGCWHRVVTDYGVVDGYSADAFELVEPNPVLTPEEVFEHLRKGTKLQWRYKGKDRWQDCVHASNVQVSCIINSEWRIKPEPEIIELNGKKYREIVE